MSEQSGNGTKTLLFHCTRQDPSSCEGFASVALQNECHAIEVPCSGRVGVGELMQGLAAGYARVAVLSCGEKSCIHGFGCAEARKALAKAMELAGAVGVDISRLVFIEADDLPHPRTAPPTGGEGAGR